MKSLRNKAIFEAPQHCILRGFKRLPNLWFVGTLLIGVLGRTCLCQDRISVVVLKTEPSSDQGQFCRTTIETQYQAIRNLKINGKTEVKSEPVPADGHPQPVTRQEYDRAKSIGIKDLAQLEIRDGVLYGLSKAGETLLLFPQDKKPEKNSPTTLADMYKISVEGQESQSKSKRSVDFKTIWKIFNLAPNDPVELAVFQHVAQENKPAYWKGYLKTVPEYKLTDALTGLRDTLSQCVNDSLQAFANGNYSALADAETSALEAKGVYDSEATQALLAKVNAEQKNIQDLIASASSLVLAGKWDDALSALEPLKKYLTQAKDLDAAYAAANDGSYDLHLQAAKNNMGGSNLAEALKEYEIALSRKPDSPEAQNGRKEALVEKTVADSRQLRQRKKPGEAREQILNILSTENSLSDDTKIAAELKLANCEFSAQLFSESQKLVLGPTKSLKPITSESIEKVFVQAVEKLKAAQDACASKGAGTLFDQVNANLASFHLEHARRAKARGLLALALLHSQTALQYSPTSTEANSLKEQTDKTIQDKVRVKVGVLFRDTSSDHGCQQEASGLAQMVEAQVSSSMYDLLESDRAESIYNTAQSQRPPNYALILGEIQSCAVQRTPQEQSVPSKYRVANPDFSNAKSAEQSAEQQYKSCRSNYGEANCVPARQNFDAAREQRRNTQEWLKYDYTYTARITSVYGQENVLLKVLGASAPNSFGPFHEEVRDQCVEEVVVRDDDDARSGICGIISNSVTKILEARHSNQNHCPLNEDEQYKTSLQQNIQQRVRVAIPFPLAKVSGHYLKLARQASDRDIALDNYLMALMASTSAQSAEFKEAMTAVKTQRPDLNPESLVESQLKAAAYVNASHGPAHDSDVAVTSKGPSASQIQNPNGQPSENISAPSSEAERPVLVSSQPVTPKLNAEMPSTDFTVFRANSFEMSHPNNWRINRISQGVIIGPSFALQHRSVVCGAIIGSYPTKGKPFEQAASDLARWMKSQTPDAGDLIDKGSLTVNGTNARAFNLTATSLLKNSSGQKQNELDRIVAIPRGDGKSVDWIVFVAPENDFHLLAPTFERMLQSFKTY